MRLPDDFTTMAPEILREAGAVPGHLTEREASFLVLLAATCDAVGDIVEIGSYKGKSTVLLARGAGLSRHPGIVAIDPLTPTSVASTAELTDTDVESVRAEFYANLEAAGVRHDVTFYEATSEEVGRDWKRPIRLLWIDGDHAYESVRTDFDSFAPHLCESGILAMHDVLSPFNGPIRVFMEDVLLSGDFSRAGFCGSIGWAQRSLDAEEVERYAAERERLAAKLEKMATYVEDGERPEGWLRTIYKLWRWRIPHDELDPEAWVESMRRPHS